MCQYREQIVDKLKSITKRLFLQGVFGATFAGGAMAGVPGAQRLNAQSGRPWATLVQTTAAAECGAAQPAAAIADPGPLPDGVMAKPMIKIFFILVKRHDMTEKDFHAYWLQKHSPLVRSLAEDMRMRRYIQSHLVPSPMAAAATQARNLQQNPYQGIAEVWWNSEEDMKEAFSTPAGASAGAKLLEDEKKFLDCRTLIFMSREYQIFDRA
jgi:uncharacterized protein (TIGR02118 family)